MKYLGIDYGKKNIGLAISDSAGKVAMPYGIFDNNENFKNKIKEIILKEKIEEIVLGKSTNFEGKENKIQNNIEEFKIFLENENLKVHYVSEIFTSMESKWGVEKNIRRPEKKTKKLPKNNKIDDKAAMMILKTFLG